MSGPHHPGLSAAGAQGASPTRIRRLHSIRVRLPLAITGLLAVVISVFAFAAHREVKQSQLAAVHDRVEVAATYLAGTSAQQSATRLERMAALAGDVRVGAAVAAGGEVDEEVGELLEDLASGGASPTAVALFGPDGRILWSSPAGAVESLRFSVGEGDGFTAIEDAGDGRLVTQAHVAVTPEGHGGLLVQSEIGGRERTNTALEDLLGSGAAAVVGNMDGSLWTDLAAIVEPPPTEAMGSPRQASEYRRGGSELLIGAIAPIPGTPWGIAVEFPRARVLAPSYAFLRFAVGLGAGLLIFGGLGGVLFSSRLTRRLDGLRNAAEAIAWGDYDHRVETQATDDEIKALAHAFNAMAGKVMQSRDHLHQVAENLRRSNAELEQFAYTASHDLQEPLRMVSSYVQLLARRYRGSLDSEADEFIDFAVDGANRMKELIDGLLSLSRVERRPPSFSDVELEDVVAAALKDLDPLVRESGAEVRCGDLPRLWVDPVMLRQVFENLISNALKFRADRVPVVEIGAVRIGGEWSVHVEDNGIGFDPEKSEDIFQVFRRLHTRQEYEGTGIGLSVCQRMVERWGGRIWAEGTPGQGSVFSFTIPEHRVGWEGVAGLSQASAQQIAEAALTTP